MVRAGEYDLATLLKNPNLQFGAAQFSYTFLVEDAQGKLLAKKEGTSFMNPNSEFIIFEPRIRITAGTPEKVFFEISEVSWVRLDDYKKPTLRIDNETFAEKPNPKLTARIKNELPEDFSHVEAIAEIRGDEDQVVAVSRSITEFLPRLSTQTIFFEWPQALPEAPQICARPVEAVLLFDLSGSMDDDGANPPQPLTDAKNAALVFFDELGKKDKVGFVSFATQATNPPEATLATPQSQVKTIIENLTIAPAEQRGRTNVGDAIQSGVRLFSPVTQGGALAPRQVMVLLTDGLATGPTDRDPNTYAQEEAKKAKQAGIDIYTIGLGKNVNQTFLRDTIAGSPDNYFFSATSKQLADAYRKVAQDVCPEKIYLTRILERTKNEMERSE
jgi:Mg-chelatase subunit ChlD